MNNFILSQFNQMCAVWLSKLKALHVFLSCKHTCIKREQFQFYEKHIFTTGVSRLPTDSCLKSLRLLLMCFLPCVSANSGVHFIW